MADKGDPAERLLQAEGGVEEGARPPPSRDPVQLASSTARDTVERNRSGAHPDYPAVVANPDDPDPAKAAQAWDNMIPLWAMKESIRDMARDLRRRGDTRPLPTQCCVGPATELARYASFVTWALFLLVPIPVFHISTCQDPARPDHEGVSAYYNTRLVWASVAPIICTLLVIEWNCLMYYIIPSVQVDGNFKILSAVVNFYLWAPFSFAVSLASHLDLVTNGIFLATTLRTMNHCSAQCELKCIWLQTMMDGMFGHIPYYKEIFHPLFQHLVWVLWGLMMIQAVYGYLGSTPLSTLHRQLKRIGLSSVYHRFARFFDWSPRGVTDEIRFDPNENAYCTFAELERMSQSTFTPVEIQEYWDNVNQGEGNKGMQAVIVPVFEESSVTETLDFLNGSQGMKTMYQTFFDEGRVAKSGHGASLLVLADSTRMVSITTTRVDYAKKKVSIYLRDKDWGPAFGLMKQVSQACGHRLVIAGILQTGIQLNLQATLLGMTTLMSKARVGNLQAIGFGAIFGEVVDRQMVFSITIGLINVIKNAFETFKSIQWISHTLDIPVGTEWREKQLTLPVPERKYGLEGPDAFRSYLTRQLRWLQISMFIYIFMIVYTLGKLVAVFQCPFSMTNINGCAVSPCCCLGTGQSECPDTYKNAFGFTSTVTCYETCPAEWSSSNSSAAILEWL